MNKSSARIYDKIIDSTTEYLDTAYLTKDAAFNSARSSLIHDLNSGPMFRKPLLEIQDRYPLSGEKLSDYIARTGVLPGIRSDDERALLSKLFESPGSVAPSQLYVHQVDVSGDVKPHQMGWQTFQTL